MAQRNFSEAEKNIVKFWKDSSIFEKTVNKESRDYVFYDGPPFATGTPHYGHIVASVLKDVVPRYWTMNGFRIERRWGWDCHGLPIENLIEKDLGLHSKKDIEDMGVKKFNNACRDKVLMYADEWKIVIDRLGRFVDMKNDYKTMDVDFMESVWWVFKELWKKDLIYRDYKAMHICPRCETTLSQSEVADGYRSVKDLSVVAKFELVDEPGTFVLAWTTTPWTLPGNVALAVREDIDYVKIKVPQNPKRDENQVVVYENVILAKEIFEKAKSKEHFLYERIGANFDFASNFPIGYPDEVGSVYVEKSTIILKEFKGSELSGKKYKPLFDYFVGDSSISNIENAYKIVLADFVTTEDGTGVVHIAPAFGQDDMNVGNQYSLPFVQHIGMDGRFSSKVSDFVGKEVKSKDDPTSADVEIIKYLASHGTLFSKQKYEHTYPHCWRCDSPLLNYATSSWFINVTKIKPRMIELAEQINWIPEHLKEGRFGNWLAGARDWSISRQRYWGSVLPIWECSCGVLQVFGSREELEKSSGCVVNDLHKDIVDEISVRCVECGGKANRIPDVLDCWFESAAMPYAQLHYPFENEKKFQDNFPAEFIAEGVDQTRAWFYYLHILGVALMDKPAFKNVIANGIVLAEDEKKMSKRLKNYPDPMYVMDRYGSDSMRLYLMTSPVVQADDLRFSEKGVEEVFRKVIMIWWNVFSFYEIYRDDSLLEMNVSKSHILDKWVDGRVKQFVVHVQMNMEKYDLMKASRLFVDFVNDISTWYLRRSRDRFKVVDGVIENDDVIRDKASALQTLREVLMVGSKVMAPFIPFITEDIYLRLKNSNDPESIHLCSWPKEKMDQSSSNSLVDLMEDVRKIAELGLSLRSVHGLKIRQVLSTFQIVGKSFGKEFMDLLKDELNVRLVEFVSVLPDRDGWVKQNGFGCEVALDTKLTEDLEYEGFSRELIRHINLLRKDKGLRLQDRVSVRIRTTSDVVGSVISAYDEEIKKNTAVDVFDVDVLSSLEEGEDINLVRINNIALELSLIGLDSEFFI